jgi:hypothetical protein
MSVPTPWSVRTLEQQACGTRPSMMCTLFTPLRAASSAEPIFGQHAAVDGAVGEEVVDPLRRQAR